MDAAPLREISSQEIRVQVAAASINPVDYKIRSGAAKLVLRYSMPLTLGHDFSGVVTQIGTDVSHFKVGDQVYGRTKLTGTFQQQVLVDEQDIARIPSNLSLLEAAAVPLVGLTAFQGIHQWIKLKQGQTILITGGAGGVGHVAVQLAQLAGAKVLTTASEEGIEFLEGFSSAQYINYKKEAFQNVAPSVDAVFDTRGGQDLETAFSIIKPGGHITTIASLPTPTFGRAAGFNKGIQLLLALLSHKKLRLAKAKQATFDAIFTQSNRQQLEKLSTWIENGDLSVQIQQSFPWTEVNDAIELVKQGRVKGKIVVDLSDM